jgi:CheY-like chemotaxis protein
MKALIVEDDKMSFLIAQALLSHFDCVSTLAINLDETLKHLESHHVDFIILDLGLPDVDGFEISKIIRSHSERYKKIPIIAISGTITQITRDKAKEYNLDSLLLKPLKKDLLDKELEKFHLV